MKAEAYQTPLIPISDLSNSENGNWEIYYITRTIYEYIQKFDKNFEVHWANIQCDIDNPKKEKGRFIFLKRSEGDESETEVDETGHGLKTKTLEEL